MERLQRSEAGCAEAADGQLEWAQLSCGVFGVFPTKSRAVAPPLPALLGCPAFVTAEAGGSPWDH